MKQLLILFYFLTVNAHATDPASPPPINQYISNEIAANSTLAGTGGSLSQAASGVELKGLKTADSLEFQIGTTNQAANQSTGGGSGHASADSTVQLIKTGRLGNVGYGAVGGQSVAGVDAGTNQVGKVDTGARGSLTVKNVNGTITEIKDVVTQAVGTGRVTANVNAGATFNTVKLQGVSLPALTIPTCPNIY